ncbi:MAG: GNAT family N-acetyltransferase [Luteibaculum sp.]
MIAFKTYNKKELRDYLESKEFQNAEIIPISYHRGLSHCNNPFAEEDDVLLIRAMVGKKMVGYLGVLPENIQYGPSKTAHMGWMSCIWVSEQYRGQRIAAKLVKHAFEAWKGNILATEFTEPAKKLYDKLELFEYPPILSGIKLYPRFALADIIPSRFAKLKNLKPLFKGLDLGGNLILDFVALLKARSKSFQFLESTVLEEEELNFLVRNDGNIFEFQKAQWILQYPWILQGNNPDHRYHFSAYSKTFAQRVFRLYKEDKLYAIMVLQEKNGHAKIPFYWSDNHELSAQFLLDIATREKYKTLLCYYPYLASGLEKESKFKKLQVRNFLVGRKAPAELRAFTFQAFHSDAACC